MNTTVLDGIIYDHELHNIDDDSESMSKRFYAVEIRDEIYAHAVACSDDLTKLVDYMVATDRRTFRIPTTRDDAELVEWRSGNDHVVAHSHAIEVSPSHVLWPLVIIETEPKRGDYTLVDQVWYRAERLSDYSTRLAVIAAVEKFLGRNYERYRRCIARVEMKQRFGENELKFKVTGMWTAPHEFTLDGRTYRGEQYHGVDDRVRNHVTGADFAYISDFMYRHVDDPRDCMVLVDFGG